MRYLQALLFLIVALLLTGFIQQNSGSVYLKYFGWSTPDMPLSLFMIIAFAAGYAVAVLFGFSGNIRNRMRAASAEKEVQRLQAELVRTGETQTTTGVRDGGGVDTNAADSSGVLEEGSDDPMEEAREINAQGDDETV